MMKKLAALLTALLLLAAPALAEYGLVSLIRSQKVLTTLCEVLDAEELTYEKDEEYDGCYLSIDLNVPSELGEYAFFALYAYEDGVSIIGSYAEIVPEEPRDELIRLCNHFSSGVYLGKFYVDPVYDELCYELFLPMDALNIRDYDRELIADYLWTAVGMLDYYQEYFLMVVNDGETADNVYAMWDADTD